MIQRVQSILLFIAGLFFAGQFLLPMANGTKAQAGFFTDAKYDVTDHTVLLAITVIGLILAIGAIFLFRNRKLQKSISSLVAFTSVALLGAAFFFLYQASVDTSSLQINAGSFLPLGSIICTLAANRFIGKDEALVKSMDRLR